MLMLMSLDGGRGIDGSQAERTAGGMLQHSSGFFCHGGDACSKQWSNGFKAGRGG